MLTTPRGSEDLRNQIGHERGLPGHLDRDGVPGSQGRTEGPDEQGDGAVPGHDDADDAGWLGVGAEPLPRRDLGRNAGVGQGLGRIVP
jgi:hypothetical protein